MGDHHREEIVPTSKALPVSVVIPAFNREREVVEALRSVWRQHWAPAETIVVDDGSTDGTAGAAEDAGAIVIRQPNRGVSAARNAGILAAGQPWIAFLDSDDLWEPDRLRREWEAHLLAPDIDLIFSDDVLFDDSGIIAESGLAERPAFDHVERRILAPDVYRCPASSLAAAVFRGNLLNTSTLLVRRQLLIEVGLYDPSFGHAEDREMVLRLLKRTDAVFVAKPLARSLRHEGSASMDHLKMALGAVTVADRVLASPDRYPPGAAVYYLSDRPLKLREGAILAMERDRFPEARRLLVRSLRERPSLRTTVALGIAVAGPRVHRLLRTVKRRFDLPGLRQG